MRNQEIQCVGRPALRPPPGKPQQHRRRGVPKGHLFHCEGTPPSEMTTDGAGYGANLAAAYRGAGGGAAVITEKPSPERGWAMA